MKLRWVLAALFLIGAAYFALFGGDYGYFDVRRLARERTIEEARLAAIRAEVARLRSRADSLKRDSATLERLAREKYGLIRSGERLYRFVDSANAQAKPTARDSARF